MSQSHESFGKYILLEKLQTGGMAEVFLGRAPGASGISRFVAIKRILPHFSEQTEFIDMFKDEAKIAVNLSHANIVSIFEFGVEEQQFYLAMDYVEGRNLRQILNKMKKSNVSFSIEQVLYIIKEVAAGLDHAHRCIDANTGKPLNIIHRDMSPQNIMLSFEGEVKIIDFGIAKAETQLDNTRTGTLKGKFGYMSPEQAEGMNLDLRTDIFALGIILWELLANDRLFIANNEVNTLRKIRDCQIPSLRKINPNISPELERIVSKALAKDRNLRYQTAAAFQREISRFLNRHYPDFSPHDFSVFVKTLFAVEILESRKKMVEYAKIEPKAHPSSSSGATPAAPTKAQPANASSFSMADDVLPPDGLNLTLTSSITENTFPELGSGNDEDEIDFGSIAKPAPSAAPPSSKAQAAPLPNVPARVPQAPIPAPEKTTSQLVKSESITPPGKVAGISPHLNPRGKTGIFDLNHPTKSLEVDRSTYKEREQTNTGRHPSFQTNGKSNTQSSLQPAPASRRPWPAIALLVLLAVGAGLFYQNLPNADFEQTKKEAFMVLAKTLGINQKQAGSATLSSEVNPATPTHNVAITSTPSGAEILIDDTPTGDSTPHILKVSEGKTIKVTIRMPGYVTFEETIQVTSARTINVPLVSERRGYLDIQVVGSGQIMVDNKVVASSSPANRIPVQAGKEVVVSAYDPITQGYDEAVVKVAENASRKVVLYPQAGNGKAPKDPPQQ